MGLASRLTFSTVKPFTPVGAVNAPKRRTSMTTAIRPGSDAYGAAFKNACSSRRDRSMFTAAAPDDFMTFGWAMLAFPLVKPSETS